jgi:hypothetical protein
MNGTQIVSLYNSVAIFEASAILRQSISQKRAEIFVVNETQSLTKVSLVDPVTSSHCALFVPPEIVHKQSVSAYYFNLRRDNE